MCSGAGIISYCESDPDHDSNYVTSSIVVRQSHEIQDQSLNGMQSLVLTTSADLQTISFMSVDRRFKIEVTYPTIQSLNLEDYGFVDKAVAIFTHL
jgi:hypothetical protein